ncbi:MAG: hypothetical protein LBJ15_19620 [Comamonas sp.]|jgi:hypothetical protein|uniref:hypothetical protein n=1 Tax=Comamonas sp. TaxID=34028 RepID=UPI00281C81F4|nr:hypothetical protein [Comamonas sp.]MDR0216185.1 hypothetical protein [Comamonas sp.]
MRNSPRLAGGFGRVGYRYSKPRISPGPPGEPGEDEFIFRGHIQDQTYKFTPRHGALVVLGFFGRHRLSDMSYGMKATYNGRPMNVIVPTYVGSDRGIPGFLYIEDVEPNVHAEVVVTMVSGECHTGAMKLMNPVKHIPIDREQRPAWSGNGGTGGGMSVTPYNEGVEQVLHVGGYGGIRTPISLRQPSQPAQRAAWIKERVEFRVESTVVPGSVTSVMFAQFETTELPANLGQWPNNFSMEQGYGLAMFCAKDMGLTPP